MKWPARARFAARFSSPFWCCQSSVFMPTIQPSMHRQRAPRLRRSPIPRRSATIIAQSWRGPSSRKPTTRRSTRASRTGSRNGSSVSERSSASFKYASRMPAFESLLMTLLVVFSHRRSALHHGAAHPSPGSDGAGNGISRHWTENLSPARILRRRNSTGHPGAGTGTRRGWRRGGNFFPAWNIASSSRPTARAPIANIWPNCAGNPLPAPALALLTGMVDAYDRFIYGRTSIGEPDWNRFHRADRRGRAPAASRRQERPRAGANRARHETPEHRLHPRAAGGARRSSSCSPSSIARRNACAHDTWLPSSFNPVGAGNMAFFQTLQDLNWPVERWREPLSRLSRLRHGQRPDHHPLAGSGSRVNFSDQEIDLLDDWVKKGNTLLLLGALNDWDDTRTLLAANRLRRAGQERTRCPIFCSRSSETTQQTIEAQPATGTSRTGHAGPAGNDAAASHLSRRMPRSSGKAGTSPMLDRRAARRGPCRSAARRIGCSAIRFWPRATISPSSCGLLAPGGQAPHHLFFEESHHGFSAIYAMARLLDASGRALRRHAGAAWRAGVSWGLRSSASAR